MKIPRLIIIDIIISAVITGILVLINYISAVIVSDVLIGVPLIGGNMTGKVGFGICVIYELNDIRFDSFSLFIDCTLVFVLVTIVIIFYKFFKTCRSVQATL